MNKWATIIKAIRPYVTAWSIGTCRNNTAPTPAGTITSRTQTMGGMRTAWFGDEESIDALPFAKMLPLAMVPVYGATMRPTRAIRPVNTTRTLAGFAIRCLRQGYNAKVKVKPAGSGSSWVNPNTRAHSPAAADPNRPLTG